MGPGYPPGAAPYRGGAARRCQGVSGKQREALEAFDAVGGQTGGRNAMTLEAVEAADEVVVLDSLEPQVHGETPPELPPGVSAALPPSLRRQGFSIDTFKAGEELVIKGHRATSVDISF